MGRAGRGVAAVALVMCVGLWPQVTLATSVPTSAAHWWAADGWHGRDIEHLVVTTGGVEVEVGLRWYAQSTSDGWTATTAPPPTPITIPHAAPSGTRFEGAGAGQDQLVATPRSVFAATTHGWTTSLFLLPQGGVVGPPAITGMVAMPHLSTAVWVATNGYGVVTTPDGGQSWEWTSDGLPLDVTALAADPARGSIIAATPQGLFVHHLSEQPAPPVYTSATSRRDTLIVIAITLASTLLGALALWTASRRLIPGP